MSGVYDDLSFPPAPKDRPYAFINMVATIDGKTVSGTRAEDVLDLGSKADHATMRQIQDEADAVIVGATTLRAASPRWDPKTRFRIVVSNRGGFDYSRPFFQGEGKAFVACAVSSEVAPEEGVERLEAGSSVVDLIAMFKRLKAMGVEKLLCFGGSELNAQLLALDLIDEIFLTIAPKVKLGRETPTFAGGLPLPREKMLQFDLASNRSNGNEVFLRYRRVRD